MRSRFFRDTGGLDDAFASAAPDRVCICLRVSREVYEYALARAGERRQTSGEYVEALIEREREAGEGRG